MIGSALAFRSLREKNYVWLKINYSAENKNEKLLSHYPAIPGYPHLFVLEQDGTLLHSQDTSALEQGPSYNLDRMMEFLNKWAPRPGAQSTRRGGLLAWPARGRRV